jgi:hypothetical protein
MRQLLVGRERLYVAFDQQGWARIDVSGARPVGAEPLQDLDARVATAVLDHDERPVVCLYDAIASLRRMDVWELHCADPVALSLCRTAHGVAVGNVAGELRLLGDASHPVAPLCFGAPILQVLATRSGGIAVACGDGRVHVSQWPHGQVDTAVIDVAPLGSVLAMAPYSDHCLLLLAQYQFAVLDLELRRLVHCSPPLAAGIRGAVGLDPDGVVVVGDDGRLHSFDHQLAESSDPIGGDAAVFVGVRALRHREYVAWSADGQLLQKMRSGAVTRLPGPPVLHVEAWKVRRGLLTVRRSPGGPLTIEGTPLVEAED